MQIYLLLFENEKVTLIVVVFFQSVGAYYVLVVLFICFVH